MNYRFSTKAPDSGENIENTAAIAGQRCKGWVETCAQSVGDPREGRWLARVPTWPGDRAGRELGAAERPAKPVATRRREDDAARVFARHPREPAECNGATGQPPIGTTNGFGTKIRA